MSEQKLSDAWQCQSCGCYFPHIPKILDADVKRCSKCVEVEILEAKLSKLREDLREADDRFDRFQDEFVQPYATLEKELKAEIESRARWANAWKEAQKRVEKWELEAKRLYGVGQDIEEMRVALEQRVVGVKEHLRATLHRVEQNPTENSECIGDEAWWMQRTRMTLALAAEEEK